MPPNMPTTANENEEWEMAGHDASQTKIQEQNASQNYHSCGNNQQLVSSGQAAVSQGPNTRARKRNRVKDEEEDELASVTKYTKTRTSATPGVKNWKAYTLCQLAKSDPESVCDLLDGNEAEIERQRVKIKSLEAEIKQEKKSHEENRRILDNKIKALTCQMGQLLAQNAEDFGTKKASDDTIKGMWWQLSYKIKNTVSNYFTERPQDETISVGGIEYHIPAKPTPAGRILAVRDSLKRRQIWGHLYCNIFAPHSRCHLGYIGGSMARRIAHLNPYRLPSPQYLQMISRLKSTLDPDLEREADPESNIKLVEMIQGTVAHFKNIVPDKMLNEFEEDLKSIFLDAWKLYTTMMTSKAIFVIEWHQSDDGINNYRYDPETMELSVGVDPSDNTSEHTFAVIESPALWKIGNGDGENFDSAMVICKHSVFEWDGKSEPSKPAWEESSS
ncbi:hypothetical protein T069G_06027 [Trichoderma breve]|uniref:Uncharacterized protein n=1 Tax=Trichoderma breve TaxID=2034170 RepID=A0A9W9BGP2_9HYPO|nr:hypothetical protein T069G_06027 [Trichoderma breve]KAJ4861039.1 hypothetical protein T069G_06027 [Trichoderma breve]